MISYNIDYILNKLKFDNKYYKYEYKIKNIL